MSQMKSSENLTQLHVNGYFRESSHCQAMSSSLSLIGCKILWYDGQGHVTFDKKFYQAKAADTQGAIVNVQAGANYFTMDERPWNPKRLVLIRSKMAVCYRLILFLRFYISPDTWVQTSLHNSWWDIISII